MTYKFFAAFSSYYVCRIHIRVYGYILHIETLPSTILAGRLSVKIIANYFAYMADSELFSSTFPFMNGNGERERILSSQSSSKLSETCYVTSKQSIKKNSCVKKTWSSNGTRDEEEYSEKDLVSRMFYNLCEWSRPSQRVSFYR